MSLYTFFFFLIGLELWTLRQLVLGLNALLRITDDPVGTRKVGKLSVKTFQFHVYYALLYRKCYIMFLKLLHVWADIELLSKGRPVLCVQVPVALGNLYAH